MYTTLKDVAEELKRLIDNFWKLELNEEQLRKKLSLIFSDANNRQLMMRGLKFKAGFERILGKKRIDELKNQLVAIDPVLYKGL